MHLCITSKSARIETIIQNVSQIKENELLHIRYTLLSCKQNKFYCTQKNCPELDSLVTAPLRRHHVCFLLNNLERVS
jgi:hypothetical protein